MRKRDIAIHVLLLFTTFGLGNVIYEMWRRNWSKKRIALGIVAVIIIFGIIGAGGSDDTSQPEPEMTDTPTPEPTSTPTDTPTNTPTETPTDTETSTPTDTPTPTETEDAYQGYNISLRVEYEGEWSGSMTVYRDGSSQSRSIDGEGSETIVLEDPYSIDSIGFNSQKKDDSDRKLTVQIIEVADGDKEIVAESSTEAEYGLAQVSKSWY